MSDKLDLYKAKIAQHYKQILKPEKTKYDLSLILIISIIVLIGLSSILIVMSMFGIFLF